MNNEIIGFGIDVDFKDRSKIEIAKIITYLEKLKVDWVRINLDIKRAKDPKYISTLKLAIYKLKQKNINTLGLITEFVPGNFTNIFFSHLNFKKVEENIDEILQSVKILSLNLEIKHWEIWNEQNIHRFWHSRPNPHFYVEFVSKTSNVIKEVIKDAKIIFGGINGNDLEPIFPDIKPFFYYKGFLKKSLKLGVSKFTDFIAFHPYHIACYFSFHNKTWFKSKIKSLMDNLVDKHPKLKFIVTEFGINPSFNFKLNIKDIAEIYKNLIEHSKKKNIPICFYNLIDDPEHNYSKLAFDNNFGFLDNKLNEKDLYKEFIKA